jgi:hypothetical protein
MLPLLLGGAVLYFLLAAEPPSGRGGGSAKRSSALNGTAQAAHGFASAPIPLPPATRAVRHAVDGPRKRDALGQALAFREASLPSAAIHAALGAPPGAEVVFKFFDDVEFRIRVKSRFDQAAGVALAGDLKGFSAGDRVFLSVHKGRLHGLVEIPSRNLAYEIAGSEAEGYRVSEWLFSDKVCGSAGAHGGGAAAGIPPAPIPAGASKTMQSPQAIDVPDLQSRPGSPRVVYLDFDGEAVIGTAWNGGDAINALPARMTPAQIRETWERVVQCFEIFDVNVTTNRAVYDAAPDTTKTHSIITPTKDAAPSAGGVAYVGSFSNPSPLFKINWTFVDNHPPFTTLVIAHEVGHTLNLAHDGRAATAAEPGEVYYGGHGNGTTSWGPIMGAPYGKELLHWSKGEYPRANNPEDDLAIMAAPQRIPLLADDHSGATANGTSVRLFPAGGSVSGNTDVDLFRVTLAAGTHTISASRPPFSQLDIDLRILNAGGAQIAVSAPPQTLPANVTFQLAAKSDIFIRVAGSGKAAVPGDDGYTNYGTIGRYELAGPQPEPDLEASLNLSGDPAFSWSTGGNVKWFNETDSVRGEVARSGPIGHNQKSHLQTALRGPGTVSFSWMVSSQPTFDYLRLLLNGAEQARISGNTTWAQASLVIPWGINTLKWEYIKNGSVSSPADSAWLDDVAFTPAGAPPPAALALETSAGNRIGSNSTVLAFQVVGLTANATQLLRIRNTGLSTLSISSLTRNGSHAADFSLGAQPASTIAPGATSDFEIRFAPTGSGNRTARLEISSNDPNHSPYVVRLAGGATPSPIEKWRISSNLGSASNSGNAANTADFDGDGMANLLEYAFGSDPGSPQSKNTVVSDIVTSGTRRHLRLYIDRRRDDLRYIVEGSKDLSTWGELKRYEGIGTEPPFFTDTVDLNAPGLDTPRFLRVKVQEK